MKISLKNREVLSWLAIVAFSIVGCWVTLRTRGQYCLPIFSGAGQDAWSGLDPYLLQEGRPDRFKYGPIWAVLLGFLNFLPPWPTWSTPAFWYCLNALAFWRGCWNWKKSLTESSPHWTLNELVVLAPLALTNGFYGQINGLLLWLISSCASSGKRNGMALSLAAWMKIFPIYLVALQPHRRVLRGVLVGIAAGVFVPFLVWSVIGAPAASLHPTLSIFESWAQVLVADAEHPHHKLGLLALLVQWGFSLELAQGIQKVSALFFFGGLWLWRKPRSEAAAITGFLFFSHMTEPPTLALLAPAVITLLSHNGHYPRLIALGLMALIVVLPSDLTPQALKTFLGGQYAIKTAAVLFCLVMLLKILASSQVESTRPDKPPLAPQL